MSDYLLPTASGRTVLLTGDLRVLGPVLAPRLAAPQGPAHRRSTVITLGQLRGVEQVPSVVPLHGNAAKPRFGVSLPVYRGLLEQVDAVVHVASPARTAESAGNELGRTRQVVDFVAAANVPLYWVVGCASSATDIEKPLHDVPVPHTIIRSSIAIGDSRTGAIPHFPGIYRVLEAALQWGQRGIWPLNLATRVDFLPVDVIADVIARLVEHRVVDREVWLTTGEQALTVGDILDIVRAHAREIGSAAVAHSPEVLGRHSYLHPVTTTGTGQRRIVTALLDYFSRDLEAVQPLESSLGDRFVTAISDLGEFGVPPLPDPRAALRASLRYWSRAVTERAQQAIA